MADLEALQDLLRAYQQHIDESSDPGRFFSESISKAIDLENRDLLDLVIEAVKFFHGGDDRNPGSSYASFVAAELVDNDDAPCGNYPQVTDSSFDEDSIYFEKQTQHDFEWTELEKRSYILWSTNTFSFLEDWCTKLEREKERNKGDS